MYLFILYTNNFLFSFFGYFISQNLLKLNSNDYSVQELFSIYILLIIFTLDDVKLLLISKIETIYFLVTNLYLVVFFKLKNTVSYKIL